MAVIFSSDLVLAANAGTVQPLTHARIMYQNLIPASTVSATTQSAGFEADAVQSYDTYDRWLPTEIPATITFKFTKTETLDYVFIASHNLGTSGAALVVEHSPDGTTWTEALPERIPGDNTPLAFLFDEVEALYMRIRITSAQSIPRLGVIMAGKALAMERPIYQGHSPITLSRQTEIRPSRSEGGQWLGRSVIRRGFGTAYDWKNLSASWYREFFDPFVQAAQVQPFGIAWRPATYPSEVAYAWTEGDIQPSNSGPRDLMSVGFSVTAHDSGDI